MQFRKNILNTFAFQQFCTNRTMFIARNFLSKAKHHTIITNSIQQQQHQQQQQFTKQAIMTFRGGSKTSLCSSTAIVPSLSDQAAEDARNAAIKFGFSDFEAWLTSGGDDRSLILNSGANKYHIKPQAIDDTHIFRG